MDKIFSLQRITHHIKRDLAIGRNTLTTTLLVAGGLLFIFCTLNMIWDKKLTSDEFMGFFGITYLVSGMVFTFSIFREAHNTKANQLYFTLPISPLERIVAIWLTTSILYTLAFTILGFFAGELAIFFGSLFFGADFTPMTIFSKNYGQVVKVYTVVQPLFLFGAISFKRNRIGKTLLFIIVAIFVFAIFNMALFGMLNYGYDVFDGGQLRAEAMANTKNDLSNFGKALFMFILGPIMLVASYFKLVEKEV